MIMNSIDYGYGQTNVDKETGIRYGVISVHEVMESWYDESEIIYSNCCPYCGSEPKSGNNIHEMKRCPTCYNKLEETDFIDQEATGDVLNDGKYQAEKSYNDTDIFITKSPYYTLCEYCSPCAPGAGYIMNAGQVKAYCFGHDFFENEKAPYVVYSVETNKIVKP